jgi:hypothetical protein
MMNSVVSSDHLRSFLIEVDALGASDERIAYGAACAQQPCDLFLIAGAVELRLGQI